MVINKINCIKSLFKCALLVMALSFVSSCQNKTLAKKQQSSDNTKKRNIVRLHSKGTFSQVVQFLHAYKQGVSRGVCEMFFTMDGQANDPCIMTRNGKAYLILKDNNQKGFRMSKLKLINRNKFINIDDESIWYLEPYQ